MMTVTERKGWYREAAASLVELSDTFLSNQVSSEDEDYDPIIDPEIARVAATLREEAARLKTFAKGAGNLKTAEKGA